MIITEDKPLLFIDNVTLIKSVKDLAMVWLSKNWESIREGVYIDDSTFRLDLNTNTLYRELMATLGIDDSITTIYISFPNKTKRNEFIQVFLNKDLQYGISKKYNDMGAGRVKQTADYKKRSKLMEEIII